VADRGQRLHARVVGTGHTCRMRQSGEAEHPSVEALASICHH
jgi:hypothetical protein